MTWSVFWDRKSIILLNFLESAQTKNSDHFDTGQNDGLNVQIQGREDNLSFAIQ